MKTLIATNEDFIKRQRTIISSDVTAGSGVVIPVVNSNGFTAGQYVAIGYEGSEGAELAVVSAVAATSITITTLVLNHAKDEPVVVFRYNKRKFYGSLTATGSYSELTSSGSPATISVTDPQGTYFEYTGVEGYIYFKATYYNSATTDETSLAESDGILADESLRYCSLHAIKVQAGLTNNPFITDGIIEVYRRRAENEVDSYLNSRYVLPLQNSSGAAEVPFLIENCTTLLAAGYMDYKEFGKDGEGVKWLGEARGLLKKLQTAGGQQLLGADKVEMTTKTTSSGIQSFPNTTDNTNGPARQFTMAQRF